MGVQKDMKYLAIAIVTLGMLLCDTSVTEAGIFRNRVRWSQRNNGAGILPYWSPGMAIGWFGQGMGGPRMVWRGDWVPARAIR